MRLRNVLTNGNSYIKHMLSHCYKNVYRQLISMQITFNCLPYVPLYAFLKFIYLSLLYVSCLYYVDMYHTCECLSFFPLIVICFLYSCIKFCWGKKYITITVLKMSLVFYLYIMLYLVRLVQPVLNQSSLVFILRN